MAQIATSSLPERPARHLRAVRPARVLRPRARLQLTLGAGLLGTCAGLLGSCAGLDGEALRVDPQSTAGAKQEVVFDFGSLIPEGPIPASELRTFEGLERLSSGVPWPRGMTFVDDQLVVLARGRHRNAGGLDHGIEDFTGSLFVVDDEIAEPVVPGVVASPAVKQNARILVGPDPDLFRLPDKAKAPIEDALMDRPYCTLVYDEASENLIICGYSGVDLPQARFRKNATDSVLRYDLRTEEWLPVEMHDPTVVPFEQLDWVVSSDYYPHHDPETNAAPHGWVNGPDSCLVVGDYLYVAGKDNHCLVQYDWAGVVADPSTRFPESRPVLGTAVRVKHPGGVEELEITGHSAMVARDGWLYIGYRTASVVLRFELDERGDFVQPEDGGAPFGELVAAFEPWNTERGRSGNLIDLAFDPDGRLYASLATEGKIWCVGRPDPARPFYGNDQTQRPTSGPPALDLSEHTGKTSRTGNVVFDEDGRMILCSGNYDSDSTVLAGVLYRASPRAASAP